MFIRYEDLTNKKVIKKLLGFIGLSETNPKHGEKYHSRVNTLVESLLDIHLKV